MNTYDLAALLAIHGLDCQQRHKLTDAQQRNLFSSMVIKGRICCNPDNQGQVAVLRWSHAHLFSYEELAQAVNEGRQVEAW